MPILYDGRGHLTDIASWVSRQGASSVRYQARRATASLSGLLLLWVLSGCEAVSSLAPAGSHSPVATARSSPSSTSSPIPQRQETALSRAHEEEGVTTVAGKLYVIGGYDSNGSTTGDVQVFDGTAWGSGPALPNPTDHVAASVAGDHLYVVGGNQLSGTTSAIYLLNGGGSAWSKVGDLTQPRSAFALVSLAGKLIVIGGYGQQGNNLSTVETFDPVTNTSVADNTLFPFPRNHVAGFAYQGMACAAGGRSGAATYARVDCYNPTLNSWQQLPDLPTATAGDAASATASGAIVLGGEDARETTLVTQLFRLVAGSWTSEPMLDPRHGSGAAIFAGRLWVPGGAEVPGRAATARCTSVPV